MTELSKGPVRVRDTLQSPFRGGHHSVARSFQKRQLKRRASRELAQYWSGGGRTGMLSQAQLADAGLEPGCVCAFHCILLHTIPGSLRTHRFITGEVVLGSSPSHTSHFQMRSLRLEGDHKKGVAKVGVTLEG